MYIHNDILFRGWLGVDEVLGGGGGLQNIELKDPLKGCYKTLDFNPKTMISKDLVVAYH